VEKPDPTEAETLLALLVDRDVHAWILAWLFGRGRAEAIENGTTYDPPPTPPVRRHAYFTDPETGEVAEVPLRYALDLADAAADAFATTASRPAPSYALLAGAALVALWLISRS
jgi:hypothetical protein